MPFKFHFLSFRLTSQIGLLIVLLANLCSPALGMDKPEEKGIKLTPKTFYFQGGACLTRYEDHIEFAHGIHPENGTVLIEEGEELEVDVREVGGTFPLHVAIDQSPENFIAALERTGLFTKEDNEQRKLGANWTKVYSTKSEGGLEGALIKHTPMGFQIRGQMFHVYGCVVPQIETNCFHLRKPPILHYLQTEAQFTQALIDSEVYDPAAEEAQRQASPWTKKFIITDGTVIERTPTYINIANDIGEETFRGWTSEDWQGMYLPTPLVLTLSQTEREFTTALQKCGLLPD